MPWLLQQIHSSCFTRWEFTLVYLLSDRLEYWSMFNTKVKGFFDSATSSEHDHYPSVTIWVCLPSSRLPLTAKERVPGFKISCWKVKLSRPQSVSGPHPQSFCLVWTRSWPDHHYWCLTCGPLESRLPCHAFTIIRFLSPNTVLDLKALAANCWHFLTHSQKSATIPATLGYQAIAQPRRWLLYTQALQQNSRDCFELPKSAFKA